MYKRKYIINTFLKNYPYFLFLIGVISYAGLVFYCSGFDSFLVCLPAAHYKVKSLQRLPDVILVVLMLTSILKRQCIFSEERNSGWQIARGFLALIFFQIPKKRITLIAFLISFIWYSTFDLASARLHIKTLV